MTISKAERLLDLVIALVNTRYYRSAEWIREHVAGYGDAGSDDAFARMLERDKQEIRQMGIPVDTGGAGGHGYRISPGDFALPPMSFTPEESAALAVASRLWDTTALREAGSAAIRKLRDASGGLGTAEEDTAARHADIQLRVRTPDAAFSDMMAATRARRELVFGYRAASRADIQQRRLQPWGLVSERGAWYVVGFDRDRQAPRTFRLSRIIGTVQLRGRAGGYTIPAGLKLRDFVHGETDTAQAALVKVRPGTAAGLRRGARLVRAADDVRGFDEIRVTMTRVSDLARQIGSHGPDAIAVDPPELVNAVIALLDESAQAAERSREAAS